MSRVAMAQRGGTKV